MASHEMEMAAQAPPERTSSSRRRSSARGTGVRLSPEHLAILRPDLGETTPAEKLAGAGCAQWVSFWCCAPMTDLGVALEDAQTAEIRRVLASGQPMPAYVVQVEPVVVAVYCELFDAAVFLRFPEKISVSLAHGFHLKPRSRLLAMVALTPKAHADAEMDADIEVGPEANDRAVQTYVGLRPEIANFISTDEVRILENQNAIDEEIWARARAVIDAHVDRGVTYRDGIPGRTCAPH